MQLAIYDWTEKDFRVNNRMYVELKLKDTQTNTLMYFQIDKVREMLEYDGLKDSEVLKQMETLVLEQMKESEKDLMSGFTQVVIYKYGGEGEGETIQTQFHNGHNSEYLYRMPVSDGCFSYKHKTFGIVKQILDELIRNGVIDVVLMDSYARLYFYTTTKTFKIHGTEDEGKVYLPIDHFDIRGDPLGAERRHVKYDKFIGDTQ